MLEGVWQTDYNENCDSFKFLIIVGGSSDQQKIPNERLRCELFSGLSSCFFNEVALTIFTVIIGHLDVHGLLYFCSQHVWLHHFHVWVITNFHLFKTIINLFLLVLKYEHGQL